jgi:hypothetical protein
MTSSMLFLIGLALTTITALGIVSYLRAPLQGILAELCGTRERAGFWVAFCNVTIMLVPVIFAMQYTPELKAGTSAVLELSSQLKWGLAGLLAAIVILGWVLSGFIRRAQGAHMANVARDATVPR